MSKSRIKGGCFCASARPLSAPEKQALEEEDCNVLVVLPSSLAILPLRTVSHVSKFGTPTTSPATPSLKHASLSVKTQSTDESYEHSEETPIFRMHSRLNVHTRTPDAKYLKHAKDEDFDL